MASRRPTTGSVVQPNKNRWPSVVSRSRLKCLTTDFCDLARNCNRRRNVTEMRSRNSLHLIYKLGGTALAFAGRRESEHSSQSGRTYPDTSSTDTFTWGRFDASMGSTD